MGIFSRKQKSRTEAGPGSERRIEGVVRRGLAETDGNLPLANIETLDKDAKGRGFDPYESAGPGDPAASKKREMRQARDAQQNWRDSGFNPYDTHSNLPKLRSWEDVPFDSVDKDRRKR